MRSLERRTSPAAPRSEAVRAPLRRSGTPAAAEAAVHRYWAMLAGGVERVAADLAAGSDAALCGGTERVLPLLRLQVARAAAGAEPDAAADDHVERVLRRRMLEALRAAVVTEWSRTRADCPLAEVLPLLEGMEQVRRCLDPEWDGDAARLLSGPDGLSLVAEVAHNLRSPLTAVLFLADNLRRGGSGPLNEVQSRQIGIIYGAALGLVEATGDLIDLSRHTGQVVLGEQRAFSLAELLRAVIGIVQPIAEEKNLEIRTIVAGPDQRFGYPAALQRVLLNLATNALRCTDRGSIEISARAVDDDRVCFAVEDTGRGIAPELRGRLLQPFLGTDEHRGFGFSTTGLGLSIVQRLVTGMQGELAFDTEVGVGTRFHFTIPAPARTAR